MRPSETAKAKELQMGWIVFKASRGGQRAVCWGLTILEGTHVQGPAAG